MTTLNRTWKKGLVFPERNVIFVCVFGNIMQEMERDQLRPDSRTGCHAGNRGQRQDDQKVYGHHIQDEGINDHDFQGENRTVLVIVIKHVGQGEKHGNERKCDQCRMNDFDICVQRLVLLFSSGSIIVHCIFFVLRFC